MPKERVDVLAYKQELFDTREQAKRGVMAGLVVNVINGERYDKPGEKIDAGTELKLKGEKLKYVSRGGLKLEKALQVFGLSVDGQTTIDIGRSEEHTSELQSRFDLVCRLLLEKKKYQYLSLRQST